MLSKSSTARSAHCMMSGGSRVCAQHARRQQRQSPCCRAAAGEPDSQLDPIDTVISLPLFPLPNVLHPAQTGQLLVYERRFLSLFRDLQAAMPPDASSSSSSSSGSREVRFGHILAPQAAPPALMQQGSVVAGYPPIAVCATVKSIVELPDGKLQVNYQGQRRCRLLTVDDDSRPYPLAAAAWLDDEQPSPQQEELTQQLEQDVLGLLQQVAKYSHMLDGSAAGGLPSTLLMYAPPPPQKQSIAEYMKKAGMPAGDRIATWQRSGSAYATDSTGKKKSMQDPYQLMSDQLVVKQRRQELFSFAAAGLLELGLVERLALLQCRDTAARLQFVAAAVQPFLQDLVARISVKQAIS